MSQDRKWSARLTQLVADEIAHYRRERGWSVQRLSDEVSKRAEEHGVKMDRPVLSNLEHGRRPTLSVAEWLVLADVLEVPAMRLVFPVGRVRCMEPLPGREMTTWGALRWAETGVGDDPGSDWDDRQPDRSLDMYHEHERALSQWRQADAQVRRADDLLAGADPATGAVVVEDERLTAEFLRGHRAEWDRERADLAATLRRLRERMRSAHPELALPRLPFALRHLDDEGQS